MTEFVDLYGGAVSAEIPKGAIDASNLREVPDQQEVFLIEMPNKLDQSLIFDLLETVEAPSLPEIISVHLDDILDLPPRFLVPLESLYNDAVEAPLHTFLVKGESRQETPDVKLFMFLVLLQVKKAQSDVIITMNVPYECQDVDQAVFLDEAQKVLGGDTELARAYKVVRQAATTFAIKDWTLFN